LTVNIFNFNVHNPVKLKIFTVNPYNNDKPTFKMYHKEFESYISKYKIIQDA